MIVFIVMTGIKHPVFAYDLTVTCGGSCMKSTDDPLFSSSTLWYPGLTVDKSIHIVNTRNKSLSLSTSASNATNTNNLGDVMNLSIQKSGDPVSLWTGTLTAFYATSPTFLLTVSENNGTADLIYRLTMDSSANNEYQNTQTVFDLNFSFEGDDESSTNGTSTDGGGGDGGGTTTTTSAGGGTTPTQSILTSLTQFVTYIPQLFIPAGPAVAGAEIEISPTPEPEKGEIEGIVAGAQACTVCFWWPLLLMQALVLSYWNPTWRKRSRKAFWLGGIIISILTYLIFLLVNGRCRTGWQLYLSTDNFWCKYFIVWVLLVFSLFSLIFRPKKEEEAYEVSSEKVKKEEVQSYTTRRVT